jgi:hypothetical protein
MPLDYVANENVPAAIAVNRGYRMLDLLREWYRVDTNYLLQIAQISL